MYSLNKVDGLPHLGEHVLVSLGIRNSGIILGRTPDLRACFNYII